MQWPEFSTKSWRTLAWQHLSRELSCSLPQPSLAKRIQTEYCQPTGLGYREIIRRMDASLVIGAPLGLGLLIALGGVLVMMAYLSH